MRKILIILLICLSVCLTSCKKEDPYTIIVGASIEPHSKILEQTRDYLDSKGYKLEIKIFNDYIIPNLSLDKGDLDANFFQHKPYLDDFNKEKKTKLASVLAVHFEPLGLYTGKSLNLENIPQNATIAVPNDTVNHARSLLLLESLGIIKLDGSTGFQITKDNIIENPYNIQLLLFEAAAIPRQRSEVNYAIINGNYALKAGIGLEHLLGAEDIKSSAASTYANVLVVREGRENHDKTKLLIEALSQQNVIDYINKTYPSVVIPVL